MKKPWIFGVRSVCINMYLTTYVANVMLGNVPRASEFYSADQKVRLFWKSKSKAYFSKSCIGQFYPIQMLTAYVSKPKFYFLLLGVQKWLISMIYSPDICMNVFFSYCKLCVTVQLTVYSIFYYVDDTKL